MMKRYHIVTHFFVFIHPSLKFRWDWFFSVHLDMGWAAISSLTTSCKKKKKSILLFTSFIIFFHGFSEMRHPKVWRQVQQPPLKSWSWETNTGTMFLKWKHMLVFHSRSWKEAASLKCWMLESIWNNLRCFSENLQVILVCWLDRLFWIQDSNFLTKI